MKIILIDDEGKRIESQSFMFANFDEGQDNFTFLYKVGANQAINAMNQLYENIQNGNIGGTKCQCNECLKRNNQSN